MPKFVIERTLPGAGSLTAEQLQAISEQSCEMLDALAGQAQWLESFVTDDKLYCIYIAADAEAIREHAQGGAFPCDAINQVRRIIDPTTAEVLAAV